MSQRLGPFLSEVYRILRANPNTTAAQIANVYAKAYPGTRRARNEVAKRLSQLGDLGLAAWLETVPCPVTGRKAAQWFAPEAGPVPELSYEPAERGTSCLDMAPVAAPAPMEEVLDDSELAPATTERCGCGCDGCCSGAEAPTGNAEVWATVQVPESVEIDAEDQMCLRKTRATLEKLLGSKTFRLLASKQMQDDARRLATALRYF
jgi:hypothetical protein